MDLHAVIHEEDGSYWAEVKELPGCFASGHDLEEVKDGLIEAIALVLGQERTSTEPVTVRVDELKLVTA
jgi:predicted RNase H-like HicB family nuclease